VDRAHHEPVVAVAMPVVEVDAQESRARDAIAAAMAGISPA
jgi:hypothetical protein